jgi:hypothetical protein
MTKKDKTQLMVLGAIILVVLIVVVYNYRDRFLPQPSGASEQFVAPKRLEAPVKLKTEVLDRDDFQALDSYGPIEITPNLSEGASASSGTSDSASTDTTTSDSEDSAVPTY